MLGYKIDGSNLVVVAMNGWADPEPAWWLNLQAHPDATVDLEDGSRAVTARKANAEEQTRKRLQPSQIERFGLSERSLGSYAGRTHRSRAARGP